jgi:hypothetical protein
MQDDLLGNARRQAEQADSSVRAAALLWIARVESLGDISDARNTLLEALEQVRRLPSPNSEYLIEEARVVAAAVAPEYLAKIPPPQPGGHERFASGEIVHAMLIHGHLDAALDYLLQDDGSASFPFAYVGNVLHQLDPQNPKSAVRRLTLLRRTVDAWRASSPGAHNHQRDHFIRVFGFFWKEFPVDEAITVAHEIVDQALKEPDTGTSAGYMNEIHFSSPRQHHLFEILHVLRHLDAGLAESLIESHDQLAVGARRFPDGVQTIQDEAAAEAERRKDAGAACEGGYILAGNPADFDRQRALIDATRHGDFEPSIDYALDKYREDTSPEDRNYAPKEFWPSTGQFRTILYQAGKRLGPAAGRFLDRIPDPDLRLFATIELAAALAGLPGSSITQRRNPNSPETRRGRIADSRRLTGTPRVASNGPTMRSPNGSLIRCPKCLFGPPIDLRWSCKCGHVWNTFSTSGSCPACHFQWEVTQCPRCGEMSPHRAWYVDDSP